MIVDLVRNDLARVCGTGTVSVPDAAAAWRSTPAWSTSSRPSAGRLRAGVGWPELFAATFPPGSVTGAPKSSALRRSSTSSSRSARGPYCGAVGWVDADRGRASWPWASGRSGSTDGDGSAVRHRRRHHLGLATRSREWAETELKAARLLAVAAGAWQAWPDVSDA